MNMIYTDIITGENSLILLLKPPVQALEYIML